MRVLIVLIHCDDAVYITKIVVQHEWNDSTCEIEESFIIIDIYRPAYIKNSMS